MFSFSLLNNFSYSEVLYLPTLIYRHTYGKAWNIVWEKCHKICIFANDTYIDLLLCCISEPIFCLLAQISLFSNSFSMKNRYKAKLAKHCGLDWLDILETDITNNLDFFLTITFLSIFILILLAYMQNFDFLFLWFSN